MNIADTIDDAKRAFQRAGRGCLVRIGEDEPRYASVAVVFARRGCGKTLLLHHSSRQLDSSIKSVYLNCEDFKRHSFPNVLIEILDALFHELEQHLIGWFGKKKRSRDLIAGIRKELGTLRMRADTQEQSIRESIASETGSSVTGAVAASRAPVSLRLGGGVTETKKAETERTYRILDDKIKELDTKPSPAFPDTSCTTPRHSASRWSSSRRSPEASWNPRPPGAPSGSGAKLRSAVDRRRRGLK